MRFILIIIFAYSLTGCFYNDLQKVTEQRDAILIELNNLKRSTSEIEKTNEKLIEEVNNFRTHEREIEIKNIHKEAAVSDYMMCSWPINFCPESVQKAGESAISEGFGGGSSSIMWYRRLAWFGLEIIIIIIGIFSYIYFYYLIISPKKLEIEKHKALIANSQNICTEMIAKAENKSFSIILTANENAKEIAFRLEQKNDELDQVTEKVDSKISYLASLKQDEIDTNHALAKLKTDLARMEMLKNAMRSGS